MATMTHEEVEEKMLDMLEEVCGDEEVRDHRDEDLFELGFLDSMAAVELLVDIEDEFGVSIAPTEVCLLYTSPSPRDRTRSRMPSSA